MRLVRNPDGPAVEWGKSPKSRPGRGNRWVRESLALTISEEQRGRVWILARALKGEAIEHYHGSFEIHVHAE